MSGREVEIKDRLISLSALSPTAEGVLGWPCGYGRGLGLRRTEFSC